jgi:hypothetical protein
MATSLSNAYVTLFDAEVKQAYQGKATLVGAVRQRRGVDGGTVSFPKLAKGVATERTLQSSVTAIGATFSSTTCVLKDFIAAEYSDVFSQSHVNFDERRELVETLASAIGRRQDQMILDALTNSSTSLTVANSIGGSNTDLNVAKLRETKKKLDTNNVPPDNRHIVIHANSLASLLSETAVTSADFASVKALVQGSVDTFLGFQFHMIGDRSEGGLAIDGSSDRTLFAFHRDSIGYGESINARTEINYVPEKTSFLVSAMLSANAVAIDAEGIVQITARES